MFLSEVNVRFEQAVYGSFPFWNRGYAMLARSAGCRPEWLVALKSACQKYGERPAGTDDAAALFAMRLDRGPWMVVGVIPQGEDDTGRPGALAFHALFVDHWTYARAGADPFAFVEPFRGEWGPADVDATLEPGHANVRRTAYRATPAPASREIDEHRHAIVGALKRGRLVAVQSAAPIDTLARDVWRALPIRIRLRASVATWAFDNGNGFDLVAMPRLPRDIRETSDLVVAWPPKAASEHGPHVGPTEWIPETERQPETPVPAGSE